MDNVVLDASALLALVFDEPGADEVAKYLPGAYVSTVNIAETATRMLASDMPDETVKTIIDTLQLSIQPYDHDQSLLTARLRAPTRAVGLSLGDRACLALGKACNAKILTADSVWREIADAVGVSVRCIR